MMNWVGIIIIFALLLLSPTYSVSSRAKEEDNDDKKDPPYHDCSSDSGYTYSSGSKFEEDLNYTLHTQLSTDNVHRMYSKFTNGTGIDQLYALYYCRGDVDVNTCNICIQHAVQEIVQKCEFKKQGIVWYEFCTLRYANHTIFPVDEEDPLQRHENNTGLVSDPLLKPYRQLFDSTMKYLIGKAAAYIDNPVGFATNEAKLSSSQTLRGIAQCSPYISGKLCETCLKNAFIQMRLWSNTRVFLPSCNIGFDLHGSPPPPAPPPFSNPNRQLERSKVIISVLVPVIVILLLLGGFWWWRQYPRPQASGETNNAAAVVVEPSIEEPRLQLARFTYSQIKDMTNDFQKILGEGGYGIVYYGQLSDDNREIAVKVLSKNDAPKQFNNEIKVLGRIHHKNLVSLIGYCDEGTSNLALIYEYMPGGDLKALLSGATVSWKTRLAIALDTAQGLDYLHTGCCPSIIHRDVKPENILLNQNLQAKVADFGFSKIFPVEFFSNLATTRVIGTPGYVDPQYLLTGQVSEKSDVYSFGVVLLELITGQKAIIDNTTNLVQWVTPLYERGDIGSVLDPRLRLEVGENYNTVWRTTDLAKKCVELDAIHRPTMSYIVAELRECFAMENEDGEIMISATTSMEMTTATISTTSWSPQPR